MGDNNAVLSSVRQYDDGSRSGFSNSAKRDALD